MRKCPLRPSHAAHMMETSVHDFFLYHSDLLRQRKGPSMLGRPGVESAFRAGPPYQNVC